MNVIDIKIVNNNQMHVYLNGGKVFECIGEDEMKKISIEDIIKFVKEEQEDEEI